MKNKRVIAEKGKYRILEVPSKEGSSFFIQKKTPLWWATLGKPTPLEVSARNVFLCLIDLKP